MIETLKRFTEGSLFEASSCLLRKLNLGFQGETAQPIDVADIYDGPMPQYLTEALKLIKDTYFIGVANDLLLSGSTSSDSLSEISETIENGGKYDGMFVFACDTKEEERLSRTQASALTRAFNRISYANPVILVIREGDKVSLATCERMNYTQEWRREKGEKLGKVSILRNVDCARPHRGHVDILDSLSSKVCKTFDELYQHWMQVFSSELLTKKFYNDLAGWYERAIQIVKFPNDLSTNEDDTKFNHESSIRLLTRLIFVWFLKQKHLIPEEFFDIDYIRTNLIENFAPRQKQSIYYDSEESKYYRLILQNLFFAMLNCPIVAEGRTLANNRRFIKDESADTPNYMRYKAEFKEGGAEKLKKLANQSVPFLNGGLFDCLDKPESGIYYDGFSENRNSLSQLYIPDYLFFGIEEAPGRDQTQRKVIYPGIIDILKRYSFTIEESTPYDQEVSLDPELLGKVFENLLAAVDPDTNVSLREQTGSFYTPREVVRYMVDESLVAYLKRECGADLEPEYRSLLSYSSDYSELSQEQRKTIMGALYRCRVLDPACGSGAFPMGILQQMVHMLKRLDPSAKMWRSMMVDVAIEDARKELLKVDSGSEEERQKIEENREARINDIKNAFDESVNYPDYARKLYLIEHCIYGADIQPIATQISKLRFFISLVVDQKPTNEAKQNFGIRPLPNLEAKFVTADTLVPLNRQLNLLTGSPAVLYYEELLQDINHRIFLAKQNSVKNELKQRMYSTRIAMAQTMQNLGAITEEGYNQLLSWDMFDQNSSAGFFDFEWMFGIKDGFDIYIGNPPYNGISQNNGEYIRSLINDYKYEPGTISALKERKLWLQDDYVKFIRMIESFIQTSKCGILAFINNSSFIDNPTFRGMRWHLLKTFDEITILDLHGNARKNNTDTSEGKDENVFNIMQGVSINIFEKRQQRHDSSALATVYHSEIVGSRAKKLDILTKASRHDLTFNIIGPVLPFVLFIPQALKGIDKYNKGFSITELMKECATGVTTARDGLVIDIVRSELLKKIQLFADPEKSDSEIRNHFFGNKKSLKYPPGDSRGWSLSKAREVIMDFNHDEIIIPLAFRVLDNRYIYYTPHMVDWGRESMYRHVIDHDNICLAVPRQTTKEWRHVFVSDKVANFNFLATGGQNGAGTHFPLFLYNGDVRSANLNKIIWDKINACAETICSAEDVFDYVYGVLHSQSYRKNYNEFLKGDFPKIPYPEDNKQYSFYMSKGRSLRKLHLYQDFPEVILCAKFIGDGDNIVSKITYKDGKVYINKTQFFDNIALDVWEMQIGDDQPAQRWLKERKGLELTLDDLLFYQKIAYILSETRRIMHTID